MQAPTSPLACRAVPPNPGWINTVEASFPELIPHLSTCKSPAQVQCLNLMPVWRGSGCMLAGSELLVVAWNQLLPV